MPQFVCQSEDCGYSFFDRSQLAAYSPCPRCEEGEVAPEYDEPTPPAPPEPTAKDRALDARAEARQMLQKHGVNNIPVNVEKIARAEGFTIERRSLGADAGEAVGRRITVNGDDPLVRQRFTIAHELGHLALHTVHGTDEYSERQCEVFAGALLMPRDILRKEFALDQDPAGLTKRFLVSREAMWIELQDARLTTKIR